MLGVVGPRQSGKSVLLRNFLTPELDGRYLTLDSLRERATAQRSPQAFVKPRSSKEILLIDEIQKAPDLFDAIKVNVDERRRPGMYVLSGSTEFSKLTGVRESLTGRIGVVRLYPMNLSELNSRNLGEYYAAPRLGLGQSGSSVSLTELERKLERGGMPGLCFLRNDQEFRLSCDGWLETTCYRDLQQVQGRALDGGLALAILAELARLEEPTVTEVGRKLRQDSRIIQRHLDALEAILVIQKLAPHPMGVGKPHYLLCDAGLASHLGAPRAVQLRTHVLTEALSYLENAGLGRPLIRHYRNEKTSRVPIVLEWVSAKSAPRGMAIQIFDGEGPGKRDLQGLRAFQSRLETPLRSLFLSQEGEGRNENGVEHRPLRG